MKRFHLVWLLVIALLSGRSSLANQPSIQYDLLPADNVLNTAVFSLDERLMNVLSSLELIAMTPDAGAGNWPAIKPYLAHLKQRAPGVYFYAMPDGNYYSVKEDFTNLNIGDRGYFKPLFAGNTVKGFPIYSHSTGRKSAVMACPITVDGKVTGALGASVYLDDLHQALNREMDLPPDSTWFVVNSEGLTMLDKDADFIFMNSLTQGSKSLADAMEKALKTNSGRMQYELGGRDRYALYRALPNIEWWMILARIEGGVAAPPPKLEISLSRFVPELQAALNRIASDLSAKLGPGDEAATRLLLKEIIGQEPVVTTASFIDTKGVLRYIEPREYKNVEGSDISGQEHVIEMLRHQQPLLSSGFVAVEGFPAVVIAHPVSGAGNKFAGSINLVMRPEFVVAPLLKNAEIPPEYELWIMQTDGRIIYDQDSDEIGKMLFSDPLYAEYETLLSLGEKIVAGKSGSGEYVFQKAGSAEKVHKTAVWDTVQLHGREWRVMLCFPSARH